MLPSVITGLLMGKGVSEIAPTREVVEMRLLFPMSIRGCNVKKNLIIVILIISLCASLYLFIHSRDSPSSNAENNVDISINIGDENNKPDKININTASVEALEGLPGIGNVLAGRIIQGRPFADIYALDRVKGIGTKTIEGIKGKVVVQ